MTTTGVLTSLLHTPGWPWWTAASFAARLPVTMILLALVLAGEAATGSLATGAALAGTATAANGLAAPWRGRRLDRGELRAGLQRATLTGAAAITALAAATALQVPTPVLFVLAAALGASLAGVNGGFRTLLSAVVPGEQLPRALTVEAVFVEVAFVTGPALAGVLALVLDPSAVLVVMAASAAASAALLTRVPRLQPPETRPGQAAWRTPGTWPVISIAASLGIALGVLEGALPARLAEVARDPELAGPLLALLAGGSAVGGLIAMRRRDLAATPGPTAALLLAVLAVPLLASGATESLLVLGALLALAGAPIAPLNALGSILLQRRVPAGRRSEGFALYLAATLLGVGAGQLLAGAALPVAGAAPLLTAAGVVPLAAAAAVAEVTRRTRTRRGTRRARHRTRRTRTHQGLRPRA